jgi:hypothetical protein
MTDHVPNQREEQVAALPDIHKPMACDYFRIPHRLWPTMLCRICQLGADAVRTSVPWAWHQPNERWTDIEGVTYPQRDLVGFLRLCDRLQLPVILELELIAESGLIAWGIPMWLLQKHPETHAVFPSQEQNLFPLPSMDHPTYVEHNLGWLGAIIAPLLELQQPAGPIAAISIAGLPAHDYNTHNTRVLWPIWLRGRYANMDTINSAWGTAFESLNDISLPTPAQIYDSANPVPINVVDEFFSWVQNRWVKKRIEWLQQRGWQQPILGPNDSPDILHPSLHVCRVEDDLPSIGAGLTWGDTAPVTGSGQPAPHFWAIKAQQWTEASTDSTITTTTTIVRSGNTRVRIPTPAAETVVYRLMLDGELTSVKHRRTSKHLSFDYYLVDFAGTTDMYLAQPTNSPLSEDMARYLHRLLVVRAAALEETAHLCRKLADTLKDSSTVSHTPSIDSARTELIEAEQSLEKARQVLFKAATSLGVVENQLSPSIARSLSYSGMWVDLASLTEAQHTQLTELAANCESYASEIKRSIPDTQTLAENATTLLAYSSSWQEMVTVGATVETGMTLWLTKMRCGLYSGELPPAASVLHDLVAAILRTLPHT